MKLLLFNCCALESAYISWLEVTASACAANAHTRKSRLVVELNHSCSSGEVSFCSDFGRMPGPPNCLSACVPRGIARVEMKMEWGNPIRYHRVSIIKDGKIHYLTINTTFCWRQIMGHMGNLISYRYSVCDHLDLYTSSLDRPKKLNIKQEKSISSLNPTSLTTWTSKLPSCDTLPNRTIRFLMFIHFLNTHTHTIIMDNIWNHAAAHGHFLIVKSS